MEFGIESSFIMKSGRRETAEGVKLANPKRIRLFGEKENHKYLGILEANTVKQVEMKKK